jgi:Flp pilus assembly protein TadG
VKRQLRSDERGQAALYAVLMFPVLMLVLALVLAVGTLEEMRTRLRAQIDMAALTATQALDVEALATGGQPRLVPAAAEQLAREYLARNLAATSEMLEASPADIAASAVVAVTNEPGDAPAVSIRIAAPVRVPLLGIAGLGPVVTLEVAGSAAART